MKSKAKDYFLILFGSFIVSIGFVFFINPYMFVPGGVFGTSIVLHTLFPQFQVGTFGYMLSIPLLLMSYFLLGKGIGVKTLVATLVTPFMMNALSALAYPDTESLHLLLPEKICGGMLDLSANLIIAAIMGSALVGIGEGLIVKGKATSGGTDIIALILHKYFRFKFSNALLGTDATVILFGLVVIGLGIGQEAPSHNALLLSCYSLVCIVIMSRTVAYVASGSKNNKLMFIVAQKDNDKLRDFVLHKLDRTGTVLESTGLYSQEEKMTLMMVVHMREVEAVTSAIQNIDPTVFVIVTDAYDAYGMRWKAFPDKHTIELS